MALYRASGDNNPFKIFKNLTYVTTGLTIYQNRVTILDGGYCVKDGKCYVKIKLKANFNFQSGTDYNTIYNFPVATYAVRRNILVTTEEYPKLINTDSFVYNGYFIKLYGSTYNNIFLLSNIPNNSEVWVYCIYPTSAT